MAFVELAFSVAVLPAQTGPLLPGPVDEAGIFTVTLVIYTSDELHPVVELFIVNRYIDVVAGAIVGFCRVELYPPGPIHDQDVAFVEFALSVTVPPAHTGPLLVGPAELGTGFTTSVVVYMLDELHALPGLLTTSEYVAVADAITEGFCNVELKPPGPVQNHAVALFEFAFSVAAVPAHTGPLFVGPVDDEDELTETAVV